MPTLRAIIFDLDDTLLVDEAVSYEVLELIAQQVKKNCDIDPKIFVSDVATIAQELWRKGACYPFCHEIGISAFEGLWGNFLGETKELTTLRAWSHHYREEVFLKALLTQSVQLSQAAVIARDLALEFSLLRRQRQRLFPKTEKVLEQLSCHYQLGLLTNGAPDLQREKIVATRCEHLFSNILISGECGIGKPNPVVFECLLQQLHVKPTEAMMVGNSLERDIAGAHAAGMTAVWLRLPGKNNVGTIVPDKTITDLQEVLDFL